MEDRNEHDMLGSRTVPAAAYYGIHTVRAKENFTVSGHPVQPELIRALAMVKKACVQANAELEYLSAEPAGAIAAACDDLIEGKYLDQFPIDAYQGGAGTSTNMNINEVIANRALEILGCPKGDYAVIHPLDHVNLHQSTNDVIPTAVKTAGIQLLRGLSENFAQLQDAFQAKEKEFADIVKIGRTEMQDAVPMTLGAEFSAFSEAVARDRWRTFKAEERLRIVNLGGTAIGTGLTAPRSYIFLVIEKLRQITGLGLARGENCIDQTANADAFVEVSAILKAAAANLQKIARDLRQLHMLGEIRLAPVQAGSSIMPGKVNPVMLESVIQGAMQVRADDHLLAEAVASGTLQINEFMPLIADALLRELKMLKNLTVMMTGTVAAVTADPERCREHLEACPTVITAFVPELGYEKTLELIQEFRRSGAKNVRTFMEQKLDPQTVARVLQPQNLVGLGHR